MVDKFGLPVVISGQIVTVFVRSGIGNDLVTTIRSERNPLSFN